MLAVIGKHGEYVYDVLEELGFDASGLGYHDSDPAGVDGATAVLALGQVNALSAVGKSKGSLVSLRAAEDLSTDGGVPVVATYDAGFVQRTGREDSQYYPAFRDDLMRAAELASLRSYGAGDEGDKQDDEDEEDDPRGPDGEGGDVGVDPGVPNGEGTGGYGEGDREGPRNALGMTVQETFMAVRDAGEPLTQEEANYVEPHDDPATTCGTCRFFLRDPTGEVGVCQVVDGPIAWFGTCDAYVSATEEAASAFESFVADREMLDERREAMEQVERHAEKALAKVDPNADESEEEFRGRCMGELESEFPDRQQRLAVCTSMFRKKNKIFEVAKFIGREVGVTQAIITKNDEHPDFTYILSPVLVPEVTDKQGDVISPDEIELAAHDFVESSQQAGLMHEQMVTRKDVVLVESYIIRGGLCKINGKSLSEGTWMAAWRVYNPELRTLIRQGRLTGVSIGGRGLAVEA